MPLCRDCAHCVPDQDARDPYNNAKCERYTLTDLVRGGEVIGYAYVARMPGAVCGLAGELFEPRDENEGKTPADATLSA